MVGEKNDRGGGRKSESLLKFNRGTRTYLSCGEAILAWPSLLSPALGSQLSSAVRVTRQLKAMTGSDDRFWHGQ